MLHIILNGLPTEIEYETLEQLVDSLDLTNKRFAIEVNANIIPKSKIGQYLIQNQDKIEIIHAVGGG